MRPHVFVLLAIPNIFTAVPVCAQSFTGAWTATGGGQVSAVAMNSQGDLIAALVMGGDGAFNGAALPYPGHIYLTRISSNGIEWTVPAGVSMAGYNQEPLEIVLDTEDNIYLAGHLGPSAHVGDTILEAADNTNTFVAKFTNEGELVWARPVGYGFVAVSIDRSATGELVIGGSTYGTQAVIGADTLTVLGNQGGDIILVKLDAEGHMLWYDRSGGPGWYPDQCGGVAFTPDGDIYMTGYFRSDSWFDTIGLPALYFGNNNGFVAKYSGAGEAQWVVPIGYGPGRIDTDAQGNAYTTNYHSGLSGYDSLLVSGTEASRHYLAKFSGTGDIAWILTPNDNNFGNPWDVYTDAGGRTWVTGHHRDSLSIGSFDATAPGLNALMVYVVNTDGEVEWMRLDGNAGITSDVRGYAIAHDHACGLVVGGSFKLSDPWNIGTDTLPIAENTEPLILRMEDCGIATGMEDAVATGLLPFPNPATGPFSAGTGGVQWRRLSLLTLAGQQVRTWSNARNGDVGDLPPGLYMLKGQAVDGRVSIARLIVE